MRQFREDNEKMWVLSAGEEQKFLAECDNRPQRKKYLADLVTFALNTGMRRGEIFHLRNNDVNLRYRFIQVNDTKNHENRKVPMNDTALALLQRRIKADDSEYIFSQVNGQPLTVLTNAYWTAVEKTGLTERGRGRDGKLKP